MRTWVTLFSQTGTEIFNLSKQLGRYPDVIITNKQDLNQINPALLANIPINTKFIKVSEKPTVEEYIEYITDNSFVTLHGWLRIIPSTVCDKYEIYNLHPANLIHNPNLKGKDPQKMAYEQKLIFSGNTIHRCTAELDAGEIIDHSYTSIEGLTLDEIVRTLHEDATNLWYRFLKKHL
jgi:folate-dependent phosphoribosylglycinamide formyltransferase PurN